MALVPKLPELSLSSAKILETGMSKSVMSKAVSAKPDKNNLFPKISENLNFKIAYTIQDKTENPKINFKQLEWLLDLDKKCPDKNQAHQVFMENYSKIFLTEADDPKKKKEKAVIWSRLYKSKEELANEEKNQNQLAITYTEASPDNEETKEIQTDTHDIRYHLEKIHNKKIEIDDPYLKKLEYLKKLRKLLKKFPFERKDEENLQIYEILIKFEEFMNLFSPKQKEDKLLLKKFCGYAQLETVAAKGTPVFGNFAFYMILKGSVQPLTVPHLNQYYMKLRNVTPEPFDDSLTLGIGECFGTITPLKGREMTTRMFRVKTLEEKCEFLKLSIDSFEKISTKIIEDERNEKLEAIRSCTAYSSWPKHTIEELMEIFEWRQFSANTILTSEGYRCPFIGFINKGECHVLRKVDVPHLNKKTGKKEKRMKQVVIGKLKENDSFGEVSVTMKEPMTCSIVTETPCKLGVIPYDKISKLDNITLRLLLQTSSRTFGDLTQNNIYEKFIEQEKKKEWKDYKAVIVKNVIDKYGIVAGVGKYKLDSNN